MRNTLSLIALTLSLTGCDLMATAQQEYLEEPSDLCQCIPTTKPNFNPDASVENPGGADWPSYQRLYLANPIPNRESDQSCSTLYLHVETIEGNFDFLTYTSSSGPNENPDTFERLEEIQINTTSTIVLAECWFNEVFMSQWEFIVVDPPTY